MEPQDQREPLDHGHPLGEERGEPGVPPYRPAGHLHIAYAMSADGKRDFLPSIREKKCMLAHTQTAQRNNPKIRQCTIGQRF